MGAGGGQKATVERLDAPEQRAKSKQVIEKIKFDRGAAIPRT